MSVSTITIAVFLSAPTADTYGDPADLPELPANRDAAVNAATTEPQPDTTPKLQYYIFTSPGSGAAISDNAAPAQPIADLPSPGFGAPPSDDTEPAQPIFAFSSPGFGSPPSNNVASAHPIAAFPSPGFGAPLNDNAASAQPIATFPSRDLNAPLNDNATLAQPIAASVGKDGDDKGILVVGAPGPPPEDPLESVNIQTFEVVQAIDKALIQPIARGYIKVVPKPVRDGIHNAVTNLDEPIVFLNFLLQLNPLKALATLGRFAINSTLGLGGLIDVVKREPFNHPHQPNNLGHTLAFYGVKPGPFLYLPLVGSTTVRDFAGQLASIPILPALVGKPLNDPTYVVAKSTISALDDRAYDDERLTRIHKESSNPYAAYRSYYLRKRQAEIDMLKGLRDNADVPVFEDEESDINDTSEFENDAALDASDRFPVPEVWLPVARSVLLAE